MANSAKAGAVPAGGQGVLGLYIFLSIILITVVIVAGCVVFFKANQFEVKGNKPICRRGNCGGVWH